MIKRTKWMSFILLFSILVSCNAPVEKDIEAINWVLTEQVSAWNAGDLEEFMEGYWNDPNLRFTGSSGLVKGWQQALDRYKNAYPSKQAMGHLRFENLDIEIISASTAITTGEWRLDGPQKTLAGYFTLVWKKIDGNWYIIADHSS